MPVKFMTALAQQERFELVEFQPGVLDEGMIRFDYVKAKADMVGTMAGERVKTDFYPFNTAGLSLGGLFFNGINNGADKGDFVHNFNLLLHSASLPD